MTYSSHLIPLIIAGPTASGKSSLALKLAEHHDGEIICADSRQFYAGMAIGTACPSQEDQKRIPHHGYGLVDPNTSKVDAGYFVSFAMKTIGEVQGRAKRPIVVGGTGLYLRALCYGLGDVPPSAPKIVEQLHLRCDSEGLPKLYAELMTIDPDAASIIKSSDRYRIIRALEIFAVTGKKPSKLRRSFKEKSPKLKAHWVYKKPDKLWLMDQIKGRVQKMFDSGLVEEALSLRERLPVDHWALTVMGYQEALMYHDGFYSLAEAKERVVIRHRQYAKRQYTWFNSEPFYKFIIP